MAKLVDAPASGAGDRKVVEVRVLFWAPNKKLFNFQMDVATKWSHRAPVPLRP